MLPPHSGNHEEVGGGGGDSSGATDRGNGEWIFAWPQGMLLSWPLAKLLASPPAWPPFAWTPARPPFAWSPPAHSPSRATVGHVAETEDEMDCRRRPFPVSRFICGKGQRKKLTQD
jgi:hypothetical protein